MLQSIFNKTIDQTGIHVRGYNSIIWVDVIGQDRVTRAEKLRAMLPKLFKDYDVKFVQENETTPAEATFSLHFAAGRHKAEDIANKLESVIDYVKDEVQQGASFEVALTSAEHAMNERPQAVAVALERPMRKPIDFRYTELSKGIDAEVEVWKKVHHKGDGEADDLCAKLHADLAEFYLGLRAQGPEMAILFSDEAKGVIGESLKKFGLPTQEAEEIREAIMAKTAVAKHDARSSYEDGRS